MSSIGDIINDVVAVLERSNIENPRREARLLASVALNRSTTEIFNELARPASEHETHLISEVASRRASGEPVAYILGEREFWSIPLTVSPATLIPRPDSETLIELALEHYRDEPPQRILDLGTGSGCLLLALLSEFPGARGVGIDISGKAIDIARGNAKRSGFFDRTTFSVGSWTDGITGTFDLVISNPPYIRSGDIRRLEKDVRDFEPMTALDGGEDGLEMYRSIFSKLDSLLSLDGQVIVEIGMGQREDVREIAAKRGFQFLDERCDVANIPRALMFHKKSVGIEGGKR